MQQVVEASNSGSSALDAAQKVKDRLNGSLARLEKAIEQYHERQTEKKDALVGELDLYIDQIRMMIEDEHVNVE
tara:strand:+ start:313 stop:534 length:222 start_codon:yes stop_codon:yes gene_type:complete